MVSPSAQRDDLNSGALADRSAIIDAVVIGRNEGPRLLACLASLKGQVRRIVYVDSGSKDRSVIAAREAGAMVVPLDMTKPLPPPAPATQASLRWPRTAPISCS
jgi:glycosyltransferase involved in cell wall biosynthesis